MQQILVQAIGIFGGHENPEATEHGAGRVALSKGLTLPE